MYSNQPKVRVLSNWCAALTVTTLSVVSMEGGCCCSRTRNIPDDSSENSRSVEGLLLSPSEEAVKQFREEKVSTSTHDNAWAQTLEMEKFLGSIEYPVAVAELEKVFKRYFELPPGENVPDVKAARWFYLQFASQFADGTEEQRSSVAKNFADVYMRDGEVDWGLDGISVSVLLEARRSLSSHQRKELISKLEAHKNNHKPERDTTTADHTFLDKGLLLELLKEAETNDK